MAELSIEERVANGVAWLDENQLGWIEHICIESLDLSDPCLCVLGQVFDQYWDAPEIEASWDSHQEAATRGFNAFPPPRGEYGDPGDSYEAESYADYAALDIEWKRVIAARREVSDASS